MDIINVTCAEIQTPAGFLYVILPLILNHTNNLDCDQSWLSEDGRLIADPSDPLKLIAPVISVSSDRLVTSLCVNLNHEIICDSADGSYFSRVTTFRARNQTAATPNPDLQNQLTPDLQHSDHFWFLALVFVIVLLMIILICLMKYKANFRCFQTEKWFICQREDDSEKRDPKADVQMKLSTQQKLIEETSKKQQCQMSKQR